MSHKTRNSDNDNGTANQPSTNPQTAPKTDDGQNA